MTTELPEEEYSDSDESVSSETTVKIKPAFYYEPNGVPVFKPTYEEFKDFYQFTSAIKDYGMKSGIVKVIPPQEWREKLPPMPEAKIKATSIESAIRQEFQGSGGIFRQMNIEQKKKLSIAEWKSISESEQHRTPPVAGFALDEPARKKRRTSSEKRPEFEAVKPDPSITPSKQPPDYYKQLERSYWRTVSLFNPMYGADIKGTLFDGSVTEWNVAALPNLLKQIDLPIPGVNTPYLYFGMWKATFAWHLEDMDLYSINFIHFGAGKQWYVIPQEYRERFERYCQTIFPEEYKKCSEYMRHKMFHMSPSVLAKENIPVLRCVQEEGEFILTFPYGYHSGYNIGYNCAESINFALENWIEIGKKAKSCKCVNDSVTIDVQTLFDSPDTESMSFFDNMCVFCGKDGVDMLELNPNTKSKEPTAVAHEVCAKWIPECRIEGDYVVDVDQIPKDRWKLKCPFCKFSHGACIQCARGKCVRAFHPYCARKAGLEMIERKSGGKLILEAFCKQHSSPDYESEDEDQVDEAKIKAVQKAIDQGKKHVMFKWYHGKQVEGEIEEDHRKKQQCLVSIYEGYKRLVPYQDLDFVEHQLKQ